MKNKLCRTLLCSIMAASLAFSMPAAIHAETTDEASWSTVTELRLTGKTAGGEVTELSSGAAEKNVTSVPAFYNCVPQVEISASMDGTDVVPLYWSEQAYRNEKDGAEQTAVLKADSTRTWSDKSCIIIQLSDIVGTTGGLEIEVGASADGPRDYKLEYSKDGTNYYPLAAENTISVTKPYETTDTVWDISGIERNSSIIKISDPVIGDDAEYGDEWEVRAFEDVYFKISAASDHKVNGETGLYGSSTGEMAVRSVSVLKKAYEDEQYDTESGVRKSKVPSKVKAYKTASKTAKITWKRVSSASGYEVYMKKGSDAYRMVKDSKKTSCIVKNISNKNTYKIYVRAYKKKNGKKVYSGSSDTVTLYMKNPITLKELRVDKKISVKVGEKKALSVRGTSGRNKEQIKSITYRIRNKKLACVRNGKLIGKKAGSTELTVKITLKNGLSKVLKSRVRIK